MYFLLATVSPLKMFNVVSDQTCHCYHLNIFSNQNPYPSNTALCNQIHLIKMEFFELIRKHLAMCGIEKSTKNHPFNVKNSTVFILIGVLITLTAVPLKEANTFNESTNILYQIVSNGSCAIVYEIIVWKTVELIEFINGLANIVEASE